MSCLSLGDGVFRLKPTTCVKGYRLVSICRACDYWIRVKVRRSRSNAPPRSNNCGLHAQTALCALVGAVVAMIAAVGEDAGINMTLTAVGVF